MERCGDADLLLARTRLRRSDRLLVVQRRQEQLQKRRALRISGQLRHLRVCLCRYFQHTGFQGAPQLNSMYRKVSKFFLFKALCVFCLYSYLINFFQRPS